MNRITTFLILFLTIFVFISPGLSEDKMIRATEVISKDGRIRAVEVMPQGGSQASIPALSFAGPLADSQYVDPLKYTLGPDDVIEVIVLRHAEFSGTYPVNMEGKIQYKFVGDIDVSGLTKKGLEEKISKLISSFIINPEVNVTILEYKSKVIYVLGEVARPGKYYMRSESIPVREAVVQAGLPTLAAAMRKCQLITPAESGKIKKKRVDLYGLLYGGNLKKNIDMNPGDVLYVPSTVMAKIIRVINPVVAPISSAASGISSGGAIVP